jgi:hypothetical protein
MQDRRECPIYQMIGCKFFSLRKVHPIALLCGMLYNQYNNTHQHWRQQEADNNNMVNMAAADFVTKQQPTGNLIM